MDNQTEWFKEWFNTKYYHILYKNRDHKEAEKFISNLVQFLKLPKGSCCLDLACGKGRHAEQLSNYELEVTGVDLSEKSIKEAKKLSKSNLTFEVHDMRYIYKEAYFDVIFNLFTSFGYFNNESDNLKMLESVKKMLKNKGLFVMDFMNVNKVIKNLVAKETKTVEQIKFHINRKYDNNHIFKNIQFEDNGNHFNFTERVQALTKEKLVSLFKQADLEIVSFFGDFNLNPFDETNSDRLIIIAQK